MARIFSLKNSKFFSGLKKICAIVAPITTHIVGNHMSRLIYTYLIKLQFNKRIGTINSNRRKHFFMDLKMLSLKCLKYPV